MAQGDPKYVNKVYGIMRSAYGDKFSLTEDQFTEKLETNDEYRQKVYGILKQGYGDKFTLTPDEFNGRSGPPGKPSPGGMGAPAGQQDQQSPASLDGQPTTSRKPTKFPKVEGLPTTVEEAKAQMPAKQEFLTDQYRKREAIERLPVSKKIAAEEQQYRAVKPAADKYRQASPATVEQFDIPALQAEYEQAAQGGRGTLAELRASEKLDRVYYAAENDYLSYLETAKPELAKEKRDTRQAIVQKQQSGETLEDYEERFLRDFRKEAIDALYTAKKAELYEIKRGASVDEYNKKVGLLSQESSRLGDEYQRLKEQPMTEASRKRMQEIEAKTGELQKQGETIAEETGVTPEVREKLESLYSSMGWAATADAENEGRFPNLLAKDAAEAEEGDKQEAPTANPLTWLDETMRAATGTIVKSIYGLVKEPKVMGERLGAEGYDFTDKMSMWADEVMRGVEGDFSRPGTDEDWKNMSMLQKIPTLLGEGVGSATVFAAGGAALPLPTRLATATTAFLTTDAEFYQEAIDAGMDKDEARKASGTLALVTSALESVIPDTKYFEPSAFRGSVINAMTSGKPFKEALKESLAAIPEAAKAYAKSGTKEFLEEGGQGVGEGVTKEIINSATEQEFYKDTFNAENIAEQSITGFLTGTGMNAMSRPQRQRTPIQEQVAMEMATNPEKIVSDVSLVAPEKAPEVEQLATELSEIKVAAEQMPGFETLTEPEKATVVSELQRKKKLEESAKTTGIESQGTQEEIARIEEEVQNILTPKKDGQEDEKRLSVDESQGKAPEQAGVIEGSSTETGAPSAVLQKPEDEIADLPDATEEEELQSQTDYDNVIQQVREVAPDLDDNDADFAASLVNEDVSIEEAVEYVRTTPEDQREGTDVDQADTPEKLAKLYRQEQKEPSQFSAKDMAISEVIGRVNQDSFNRFGDPNKVTGAMARRWFKKGGKGIDQVAQEASNVFMTGGELASGEEVTTDDVVDFLERYPGGFNPSVPANNPRLKAIAEKYREMTGKNLSRTAADAVLRRLEDAEDEIVEAESKLPELLTFEQGIENIASKIDDEGYWTVFPHALTKEEYNALREEVKRQTSGATGEGPAEGPETDAGGRTGGPTTERGDREEGEVAEPPAQELPPLTPEEEPEGERKVASRAKRVEKQQEYKDALENYQRSYPVVKVAEVSAIADDYMGGLVERIESGENSDEVFKEAWEYAQSLITEDSVIGEKGVIEDRPKTKAAFAVVLAQKVIDYALKSGNTKEATDWNVFLDESGRYGGTIAALLNSGLGIDPLANIIRAITQAQDAALAGETKSGRKKKDVVAEIQEEVEAAKKEASADAVETDAVDKAIDKATEEKAAPKPQRRPGKKAELEKRRKVAIDRVKKAFAAGVPGPLMAASPQNAERVAALAELARVEIESGAYTLSEVVAAMAKKIGQYVSKKAIREAVESEWESLSALAQAQKREDLTKMVKDAIEGKSTDKIIKALGKAIKIVRPDFIRQRMKGKRISENEAVREIMDNPDEAREILTEAIATLTQEVNAGMHLELAGGVKPSGLSQAQWDSARGKKVIGQFQKIVDTVLGEAVEKQDIAEQKADEKERQKEQKARVKTAIKEYYGKKNTSESLNEYLAERFPDMSMQQINDLAAATEAQMARIIAGRDKTKIKKLVNEMTDGRDEANAMKVVSKSMSSRGAMSGYNFANLLSDFLGFKGVPNSVANRVVALTQIISQMPPGSARSTLMNQVNTLVAPYIETGWAYWDEVINTLAVRNILSGVGTAFTGGISVMFLTAPRVAFNLATRPRMTVRAIGNAWDAMYRGKSAIKSAGEDTFVKHRMPVSRELPADDNPFAADNAWLRTRKMTWKDVFKMWDTHKGKAISHAVAKAMIYGTFQGKMNGITNWINDFQSFLDYMNVVGLRDMYLSIEKQKELVADGMSPKDPAFRDAIREAMGRTPQQLAAIEQQITTEENAMRTLGTPVPRNYRDRRRRELIDKNSDQQLLNEAHFKAVSAVGMGSPETIVGAGAHAVLEMARFNPKVKGQMNALMFAARRITFPITLFSRMMLVLGERAFQYTPIWGPISQMVPYTFTRSKDGFVMVRRHPDGTKINNITHNTREYATRMAVSSAITAMFLWFLSNAWDEEEVVDPRTGDPVPDPTNPGKNLTRRVYKWGDVIDFYGDNPMVKAEMRGSGPRNAIRVKTGEDENGMPVYKDYPMQAIPIFYGVLKAIGGQRDSERYFDETVWQNLSDEGQLITYLEDRGAFDPIGLSVSAGVNSFSMDFSAIAKISDEIARGNTISGTFDVIATQQMKSVVNPKIINDIEKQFYNLTDRHKIYVNYKIKDDGLDKSASYLMKDIWFTDPFIYDRVGFESVDPFGNPIAYPPIYTSFTGMFGGTSFEAMAIHESEHKDLYNLYRDEDGEYMPSTLSYPERYIKSSYTAGGIQVKVGTDLRRKIADDAYRNNGELIRENLGALKKMDYQSRAVALEYLWDAAKYKSTVENLPDASPAPPEIDGKIRDKVSGAMRKRVDFFLSEAN